MRPDIEAIKKRCEAATPEPWKLWDGWGDNSSCCVASIGNEVPELRLTPTHDGQEIRGRKADFEFIAHSRQDIPDLIAEIRRLREGLEEIAKVKQPSDFCTEYIANAPCTEFAEIARKLLDTIQEKS